MSPWSSSILLDAAQAAMRRKRYSNRKTHTRERRRWAANRTWIKFFDRVTFKRLILLSPAFKRTTLAALRLPQKSFRLRYDWRNPGCSCDRQRQIQVKFACVCTYVKPPNARSTHPRKSKWRHPTLARSGSWVDGRRHISILLWTAQCSALRPIRRRCLCSCRKR